MSKKKVTTLIVQFENSIFDPKVDKFLSKINKLIGKNEDIIIGTGRIFPNLKNLSDSKERFYAKDEVLKFKWVKPKTVFGTDLKGEMTPAVKEQIDKAAEELGLNKNNSIAVPFTFTIDRNLVNNPPKWNDKVINTFNVIPTLADIAKNKWPSDECNCEYCKDFDAFISLLGEENEDLVDRIIEAGFTSEVLEGWDKEKALTVFSILDKLGKLD